VVRLIAPHLKSKQTDPAVLVLDEAGKFVIPVLSGHLGGANQLAGCLALALGATAVLTTASDVRSTVAVDLLGRELGWSIEASDEELLRASAAVVNDEPVALVQEAGSRDWWTRHANGRAGPLADNITRFDRLEDVAADQFAAVLWISLREMPADYAAKLAGKRVVYRPDGGA
jgi:cobalt-precorrin 5A hydrolase